MDNVLAFVKRTNPENNKRTINSGVQSIALFGGST